MRQCATVIANQYGNSQAPQVVGSQSCLNPAPFRNNLAFQSQGHCSLPRLGRYWNAHVHALGQGELFWISPLKHSDPCPTSMDQWKLRSKNERKICLTCLVSGQLTTEWKCKFGHFCFADRPGSSRLCHRRLEGGKEKIAQEATGSENVAMISIQGFGEMQVKLVHVLSNLSLHFCVKTRLWAFKAVYPLHESHEKPLDGKRHGTPVRSWRVVGRPKLWFWPGFGANLQKMLHMLGWSSGRDAMVESHPDGHCWWAEGSP